MFNKIKDKVILVTGGAGFIGSHIVERLLELDAREVRVLDNLSNGKIENIQTLLNDPRLKFIEGDIRDENITTEVMKGVNFISHQAALGSVPRSIDNPITTNEVNISGFLNVLVAAKNEPSVEAFVYAASSSTYGDHKALPKLEKRIGKPLSPYAVTKYVNEIYSDVFYKTYGFKSIGLRYFNVFGPRQDPNNPYAAVIPIFLKHASMRTTPTIYGDGLTSRDFTFVSNVVEANILALCSQNIFQSEVLNIACGEQITLNELWDLISNYYSFKCEPFYVSERKGDVKHSLADISKAFELLNYKPEINVKEGLIKTMDYYKNVTQL